MTNTAVIWDLDGTLLDSYDGILHSLLDTLAELSIYPDPAALHSEIIASSVNDYLQAVAERRGLPFTPLKARFNAINDSYSMSVSAMPGALELLKTLSDAGVRQFVYTHKGKTTHAILSRLGLAPYFTEVLTSEHGFKRKPDPQAVNFLLKKYRLQRNRCWYIGDRNLDVACGYNAGIRSILFLLPESTVIPSGKEDAIVHRLPEIADIVLA